MQAAYAGNNITGTSGLIAVDKVGNHIRFYDPQTFEEIQVLPSPGKTVHELAISHDRTSAYVPLYGDGIYGANKNPNNKIVKIDLAARALTGLIQLGEYVAPHGMAATPDGDLWVVCDIPDKLLRIDTANETIKAVYDCPGKGAHLMSFSPDWRTIYVSHKEGPVGIFDVASGAFTGTLDVGELPRGSGNGSGSEGIMPSPDGKRVLVLDNVRNDLQVFDAQTRKRLDRVSLIQNIFSNPKRSRLAKLMFSPNGDYLAVTTFASGNAWIIDAQDYRNQHVVPVAKGPQGMAFSSDGASLLVSSHDSGLLTRIDLASRTAIAAYDGGSGIEVLCWY